MDDSSDDDEIMARLNGENKKPLVFAKKSQPEDITESEIGQKASDEVTVGDPIMDESSNQTENSPYLIYKASTSNSATKNEAEIRCGLIINFTLKL